MNVLLVKAEKACNSARVGFDMEDYDACVNRAYYCVFYCEKVLLLTQGITTDSHKHTHNEFNRLFVKTEKFKKDTSKIIQELMQKRHMADYNETIFLSDEDAEFALTEAHKFLEMTKAYLETLSGSIQ